MPRIKKLPSVTVPGKPVGEISAFRAGVSGSVRAYKLDSTKVNYTLAREIYNNTEDKYKLGGGFARPIIDTCVSWMGVPKIKSTDDGAQVALDAFFPPNTSKLQQVHRDAMINGDVYVWLTREELPDNVLFPELQAQIVLNILPPDIVAEERINPNTDKVEAYVFKTEQTWIDAAGQKKTLKKTVTLTAEDRTTEFEGDIPPDAVKGAEPNPWGFIPVVHFRNEWNGVSANGTSDLEAVEPFLKAYHDLMLMGIQAAKLHSTPRIKMKLRNALEFIKINFGVDDPQKWIAEGKTINLDGHDILFLEGDDDAEFVEAKAVTGGVETLLKLLFYCIVDCSQTPEFAFGVHLPSSLSSVKEQMPVLIKKVGRKRENFTDSWQMVARMYLAMESASGGGKYSTNSTTLVWDEIDPRDDKEIAEALKYFVDALRAGVEGALISQEAAVTFLARYIDTMNDWVSDDKENPGERERIIKTMIDRARLEDAQLGNIEQTEIDKALNTPGEE
jgi:hypothetical protein